MMDALVSRGTYDFHHYHVISDPSIGATICRDRMSLAVESYQIYVELFVRNNYKKIS